MSLSTEALVLLEGLDLQEARDGLSFSVAAEGRQSVGADLSNEELAGLRSWDLSGVLAGLNSLTFEAVHPELTPSSEPASAETAAPTSDVEELPDWLRLVEEAAPPAGAGPPVEETAEPAPFPEEQPAAEETEEALAAGVAGAGGKMRRFFESEKGRRVLAGAEFATGGLVGVAIAEISKLDPAWEAGIVVMAQSALGLSRLGTELGARTIEAAEARFPRFARLSAMLAGEKGIAGVLRKIKTVATRIQNRPFLAGLSAGIISHSAFEMITGHSIFPDANAAEPTPGPAADTETPTVTATETPTGTPTPEATPVSPEVTQQIPEQAALEAATRTVMVNPGDTLTELVARAGGDPYGADFTNTVLQSADVLTGPQNPNRDVASALIDFIKAHPGEMNWRDAINGVGDLAKETVGGVPLKDAIATATRMIYPGQIMKVVVGAAMP